MKLERAKLVLVFFAIGFGQYHVEPRFLQIDESEHTLVLKQEPFLF